MRILMLVCGGALCLAGCAGEPIAVLPDGSPIYSRAFAPTSEDGTATVECRTVDNILRECKVVAESPAECGYGDVALATLEGQTMTPRPNVPPPIDNRVQITVRLRGC